MSLLYSSCSRNLSINGPIPEKPTSPIDQKKLAAEKAATEAAAAASKAAKELDSCDNFKVSLPADYKKDTVDVLENPDDPNSKKIKVFYYGRISDTATPIFFINSGPGRDSHPAFRRILALQAQLDPKSKLNFVFMDQRGNGCSDFYPQGKDLDTVQRLTFYGSKQIAYDAEEIRKKLIGGQVWITFGQGYGGYIVHRYASLFARSLKAAFVQGNALSTDSTEGYQRVKARVKSEAQVLKNYLAINDDGGAFSALHEQLKPDTCFEGDVPVAVAPSTTDVPAKTETHPRARRGKNTPAQNPPSKTSAATPPQEKPVEIPKEKEKICGYWVTDQILPNLLGYTDQWPNIHKEVNLMVQNGKINKDNIQSFLKKYYFGKSNPLNRKAPALRVIEAVDRNVPTLDYYQCDLIRTDLSKEGIMLDQLPLHECMAVLQDPNAVKTDTSTSMSDFMRFPLTLTSFLDAVTKEHATLPFYLYSGVNDPFTPPESYAEEATALAKLKNGHYQAFEGSTNDGNTIDPKMWNDLSKIALKDPAPIETKGKAGDVPVSSGAQSSDDGS